MIKKSHNHQTQANFKPIGLGNTIYKMISKTIVERLTLVLPNIIDQNQRAFLKDRGVAPIALAGLEFIHQVVHSLKSIDHQINIATKLDLSKTFDRV